MILSKNFDVWARGLKQPSVDLMRVLDGACAGSFRRALDKLKSLGYIDEQGNIVVRQPGEDDE